MTVEPKNIRKPKPIKEVQKKIDDILSKTHVTNNTQPQNIPKPPPPPPIARPNTDINSIIRFVSQAFLNLERTLPLHKTQFYDPEEKCYITSEGKKIEYDKLEALSKKCINLLYQFSRMKDLPEGSLKQFLEAQEELKNMKVFDTEGNEVPPVSTETTPSDQNPPVYI
jgi:hypothetical protein